MADTSRIRPWTAPVTAIAAALSLAACGSSGSGGGAPAAPTEPVEIAYAAEQAAVSARDDAQQALADAIAVYVHNNEEHVFSGEAAHLTLNGGDSEKAIEQVRALFAARDAIGDVGVEGDPDAGVEAVAPSGYIGEILAEIADLEARRDAAAGDERVVTLYSRRIEALEAIRDAAIAVRDRIVAEVMRVTRGDTSRAGYTEDTPDRGERDVANSVAAAVRTALEAFSTGTVLSINNNGVLPSVVEARSRFFTTAVGGQTAGEILSGVPLVDRTKGDTMPMEALPLDGERVDDFTTAPRFTESDDTTVIRLSPDGDGWIAADETEVLADNRFSIGRAFPANVYWQGFRLGGTVHCLGECRVEDGRFAGDWYAEFAAPGGLNEYRRYQRRAGPAPEGVDELSEYEEVSDPYLVFGYWLIGNTGVQTFITELNLGTRGEGFNLLAADLADDDLLNDETSATYSGPAAGMSVRTETRTEGEGDDAVTVTDSHSGHFLADAELTMTFAAAAADRSLSGTIDNFRVAEGENPLAIDDTWSVTLQQGGVGDDGTTVAATAAGGGDRDGSWTAYAFGNDPASRPLGVGGGFVTWFTNGVANGVFVAERAAAE